jgi:hypothetical protein
LKRHPKPAYHSDSSAEFAKRLRRLGPGEQEFTDLDFMSYSKFRDAVRKFFESGGYARDELHCPRR